jgi:hypothetical protein
VARSLALAIRPTELVLRHRRATRDVEPACMVEQLVLRPILDVDAAIGDTARSACGSSLTGGVGIGGARRLLRLPVIADFLE